MIRTIAAVVLALSAGVGAQAQHFPNLEALLTATLGGPLAQAYFLPDALSQEEATEALGVVYIPISPGASNTEIRVGHYRNGPQGFQLTGPVQELFGLEPREAVFYADRIEVTTTMPQPGDSRCCPTGTARWSIPRQTMTAVRVR